MDDEIIVQVKQGALRGKILQSFCSTSYVAFQSVPYAAPPIGNLRFKDPKPPHPWEGTRDSLTQENNCCIQKIISPRTEIIGAEDCLYLNIYVPLRIRGKTGIAVMVWIHSANYHNGSGEFYHAQPDYLMEKDIILITVNYRLGVFGFLNLNHQVASGNQGLKDQVAALEWIKENIAAFGGDPNNITLFGCNTGAICVHLLMLSPLSKDLFHKAILQSGVATQNWRIRYKAIIECSYRLASVLGCNASEPHDIITFLEGVSATDIINAQHDILHEEERQAGKQLFGLSKDTYSERPFFTCSPVDLFNNNNQKPLILGHTTLEYMRFLYEGSPETLQTLYNTIPLQMRKCVLSKATELDTYTLWTNFQRSYFDQEYAKGGKLVQVLQCYSDIFFNIPIKMIADIRRKFAAAPTYLYEFSYVGDHKIVNENAYSYNVNLHVSTQYDDVPYLFHLPRYKDKDCRWFPPLPCTDDFEMVDIMTSMWTNFAQTGDPTPCSESNDKWKPATKENFYFLKIDNELGLFTVTDYLRLLNS